MCTFVRYAAPKAKLITLDYGIFDAPTTNTSHNSLLPKGDITPVTIPSQSILHA
jgi:hypothetical protein